METTKCSANVKDFDKSTQIMLTKSEALETDDRLIAAEAYPSFCNMKEL